jgi:hypothetical protein
MLLNCPMIEMLAPILCNGPLPLEAISQATTRRSLQQYTAVSSLSSYY